MAKDDENSIFDELDDKLDDFFAEDEDFFSDDDMFSEGDATDIEDVGDIPSEEPAESEYDATGIESEQASEINPTVSENSETTVTDNPLEKLKAIVLEMDWEISEENLSNYLAEINRLIANYRNDRPIYLFFKLHAAIGTYMLTKKARAHPEALKFLYNVYNSLEKALTSGVPLIEKNRMILNEVNNFKTLKKNLFPGFYPDEIEPEVAGEPDSTGKRKDDTAFDISSLPEEVQNGINQYIEKTIAEKLKQ